MVHWFKKRWLKHPDTMMVVGCTYGYQILLHAHQDILDIFELVLIKRKPPKEKP